VQVWHGLDDVGRHGGVDRSRGSVVTIGNFDGVHRGHQQVVAGVVARAAETGALSVVTTFDPHPMSVIHPDSAPLRLTDLDRRLDLLDRLGVGATLVLPFTRERPVWEPRRSPSARKVSRLPAARWP
jgi:riboflavin kinase/FMN adenylyltransferase